MASRPQLPELDFEAMTAEEILARSLDAFPGRVSLACSFQKEESVLLDMLFALEPKARVFALDTHVLFPETYAVWREVERRYGTTVEVYEGPSLGRQAAAHGDELWETQPDALLRDPQGRAARPRARRPRRAGSPASAATSRRRARTRRRSAGTRRTSSGRRTRSPTGTTSAAGPTSASASCPTTRCTTAATPRSAARTARCRAPAARAAGPAPTRPSAASTVAAERVAGEGS